MCEIDMVETGGGNRVSISKVQKEQHRNSVWLSPVVDSKSTLAINYCHQGETGEMTHDTTL